MHKIDKRFREVHYYREYASNWDELSEDELLAYSDAQLRYKDDELLITILSRFLKLPPTVFFNIPMYQIRELFPTIEFLFEKEISTRKLIIPKIKIWNQLLTCYGPGLNFRNITVAEFAFAEMYLKQYQQTKDENDLDIMIAAIYRPASLAGRYRLRYYDADVRLRFNDRIAKRRGKRFKNLPKEIKQGILYNFIGLRTYIISNNESLFKNPDGDKSKSGWVGVMHNLAGAELGTLTQVQEMLFFNALAVLKKLEEDRLRAEERIRAAKEKETK